MSASRAASRATTASRARTGHERNAASFRGTRRLGGRGGVSSESRGRDFELRRGGAALNDSGGASGAAQTDSEAHKGAWRTSCSSSCRLCSESSACFWLAIAFSSDFSDIFLRRSACCPHERRNTGELGARVGGRGSPPGAVFLRLPGRRARAPPALHARGSPRDAFPRALAAESPPCARAPRARAPAAPSPSPAP